MKTVAYSANEAGVAKTLRGYGAFAADPAFFTGRIIMPVAYGAERPVRRTPAMTQMATLHTRNPSAILFLIAFFTNWAMAWHIHL